MEDGVLSVKPSAPPSQSIAPRARASIHGAGMIGRDNERVKTVLVALEVHNEGK